MIEPSQTQDSLYDRLMSLKPDGLSTRAWTINAGVSSAFFDQLAAGGTPREGELAKILAVVGITLGAFEGRKRSGSPATPAAPPVLRVMAREPKAVVPAAPIEPPAPPPAPPEPEAQQSDAPAQPEPAPRPFAGATAEAIERWLEARRQVEAAGLDIGETEGRRLVTDIARLALELECARNGELPAGQGEAG